MVTINFYLDKRDKAQHRPIHLRIREKGNQVKLSLGEKVKESDWDKEAQVVREGTPNSKGINSFLALIRSELMAYLDSSKPSELTTSKVRERVMDLVNARKENSTTLSSGECEGYLRGKQTVTFIDLFAGAGGFSEGFLQAEHGRKLYDFLLASDINENCELTHLARYNYQLGLDMSFLRQDISEADFLDNLIAKVGGRQVDVVCGGPPCQSFSLAGKRKKYDKKDDLFSHYLGVIRRLRPKYFVMENVKGILTKEGGRIKEMILNEIRSIIDLQEFHRLDSFLKETLKNYKGDPFLLESIILRLEFESATPAALQELKERYIQNLEAKFRALTPKIVDYKTSKTDDSISTIRHGLALLKREAELAKIKRLVIHEKAFCDLDNDHHVGDFNNFLSAIEAGTIIERIDAAFRRLKPPKQYEGEIGQIISALGTFVATFDECIRELDGFMPTKAEKEQLVEVLSHIRLYNIEAPFVALASNYGVPQNRERVLFIGCRKDQRLVKGVPPTVPQGQRVTVLEALHDLDFIGNGEEKFNYQRVDLGKRLNGSFATLSPLVRKREVDGNPAAKGGKTYAEWSRMGRLNGRFSECKKPFYVRNFEELGNQALHQVAPLQNHKASQQNDEVVKRLDIIRSEGDYERAKAKLKKHGLESDKRNYNVLRPDSQSPTMLTIPDDYIHYSSPRALTVREMARLQSFDDSFVFQGKRSTGGNKRKSEVPQFTLVGNAVPPLMARAIGLEILKNIE